MDFIDLGQSKVYVEEPKLRISMRILKRSMRTLKKGKANKTTNLSLRKHPQIKMGLLFQRESWREVVVLEFLRLLVLLFRRIMLGSV